MIHGSLAKQSIPCPTVQSDVIERVTIFKLAGVTLLINFMQKLLHDCIT